MTMIPIAIFLILHAAFLVSAPDCTLVTSWNPVIIINTVAIDNPININHCRYGAISCLIESNVFVSLYFVANCQFVSEILSSFVSCTGDHTFASHTTRSNTSLGAVQ